MEDIIAKPIDPSASVGSVADAPPTPTISPIRQRIVGSLSRYPLVKHALVKNTISRPIRNPASGIEAELAEVRSAWARYRTTNSRDAVYIYLEAVFALVTRWRRLDCAVKKSRVALRLQHEAPAMKPEPFGIVIFCTSHPEVVDAKTRSKWSRVLRYAQKTKPAGQRLTDFIESKGGLNECARRFARRLG
jgi:hypothetical protein